MIGQTLSHYRVLEKLGEGGMGVVYKARDTHLDRFVAIKVLPPERVADPVRKARFVQEAKAASALNHPNIITVHDISSDAGHDFIVMEYVAGKTLDQLIPRKGMRLGETLKIAAQIADALARAHAAGIIHRDLKPANVMVDEHGLVKVLDFGLAKLIEQGLSEDESTATIAVKTDEGAIVGTAAYMSPEQAEGKKLDARLDIFSFGAVLYEMVAGQRAFQGDSKMSTLSAVLHKEPAPLPGETPRELGRIVTRCLRKDPERRFQHMADVKVALEELKEESDSGKLATPQLGPARKGARRRLAAAAVVPLVAVAVWFLWRSLRTPVPAPRVVSLTSYPGVERHPAFSPDGRQVAFSWNGEKQDNEDIYVLLVGTGAPPLRLTSDPAPDRAPVWSPDGAQIAFVRDQGGQAAVYVTPALGGQERKVADFRPVPRVFTLMTPAISWSPDGKWLAIPELGPDQTNGIFLVPVERGEVRKLISNPIAAGRFHWPVFSPKGDFLAYASRTGERSSDLYVLEVGGEYVPKGQPRRLTRRGAVIEGIAWARDGQSLVYATTPDLSAAFYLWREPISGGAEPERLELTGEGAVYPAVSRTGNRLAYSRNDSNSDIWKFEAGTPPQRFISSTRNDFGSEFSPDGKRIAFATDRSGAGSELWVANRDGTNLVRLTKGTGGMLGSPRWSPDGRWIAFNAQGEDGRWDIYRIDSAGGQPRRLTPQPSDEVLPSWSRDGRWIHFASNGSGRNEVWRMPGDGGERVQITHNGGSEPIESRDGKTLYYRRGSRLIARLLASGEERQILEPVPMMSFVVFEDGIYHVVRPGGLGSFGFELRFLDFATGKDEVLQRSELQFIESLTVSPDRKTILCSAAAANNADLMLVENFR